MNSRKTMMKTNQEDSTLGWDDEIPHISNGL